MTPVQSNDPYPLSDYLLQLKPGSPTNFQRNDKCFKKCNHGRIWMMLWMWDFFFLFSFFSFSTFYKFLPAMCLRTWIYTAHCGNSWAGTCNGQRPALCLCSSEHQWFCSHLRPISLRGSCDAFAAELKLEKSSCNLCVPHLSPFLW